MAYRTDYEPSAGYVMGQVVIWTKNMLGGGTAFGTATNPTLAEVESLIDARTLALQRTLVHNGYATAQPVGSVGTAVCTVLSQGIAFGVVADIEMSRPTAGAAKLEENARYRAFNTRWGDLLKACEGADLEYMGALRSRNSSDGLLQTGTSWAEQINVEEDPDQKGSLFGRGFGETPQLQRHYPSSTWDEELVP